MKSVQTEWGNVKRKARKFHWNQFRHSPATVCAVLETGERNTNRICFYSSRCLKIGWGDRHVIPGVISTKTEVSQGSRSPEDRTNL